MNIKLSASYISLFALIALWAAASLFIVYYTPERIVESVGAENAYLFLSALAFLSGVSVFGSIPYHLVLVALSLGGLDPLLLGAAAAAGVMIGDSTSYLIGYHARIAVPRNIDESMRRLSLWLARYPRAVPAMLFVYGSLVPFSNDFIGIGAGLMRYPFARVIIPLGLGNLVFNVSLALLAPYASGVLQSLFNYPS